MLTGNKGEWSEVYTLLKILADKQLYAGDQNLTKIENMILPIVKIIRDETKGQFNFSYNNHIVIIRHNAQEITIPIVMFQEKAIFLLKKLKENTEATFAIPEIEQFLNSFKSNSLKAKSSSKSDIKIVIHDQRIGGESELGFSIKSQLGRASTLLNPGKSTNFIYQIHDLDATCIQNINKIDSIHKIQDRLKELKKRGSKITFDKIEGQTFENNLMLIDSALPHIVAEMVLLSYTSKLSKVSELTEQIQSKNPLNFDLSNKHPFYSYKIKRLLTDVALGMTPYKVWNGKLDATGGYLVVKESGDILCYHIYNRNEFENYLFSNTRIITPSTSRYDFGYIFQENDRLCIKLNLQIRFIK